MANHSSVEYNFGIKFYSITLIWNAILFYVGIVYCSLSGYRFIPLFYSKLEQFGIRVCAWKAYTKHEKCNHTFKGTTQDVELYLQHPPNVN